MRSMFKGQFLLAFLILAFAWNLEQSPALHAQTTTPVANGLPAAVRCPSPEDPRKLYSECRGRDFEFVNTLSQDWAGFRRDLRELGISPTASYTMHLMGNVSGGQSRGFTYAGSLETELFWDLERLLRIPGLSFNVAGAWSTGKSLSADYIGNAFAVQGAYTAPPNGTNNLTLGEMFFQQQLFNNALTLAAGRIAAAETFATMPVLNNYLNAGINAVPAALGINDYAFTSHPPGVEWGATAILDIGPKFQIAAGVFNNNQRSANAAKGGHEFALQQGNRGVLSVVQVNYLVNHEDNASGLPGQYSFGGFYDSNRFSRLPDSDSRTSGMYSLYGLFQQMVYRDGDASSQKGLTVWGEFVAAPKGSISAMPYFAGAGLSYQGLLPKRDDDIASVAIISGLFSRDLPRTSAETLIELNYEYALYRWLSITPALQYVIRPSGDRTIRNALVLGTELAISF